MYESLISVALGCSAGMIPAFLASCVPKLLPPACNALRALTWCALPIHAVPDLPPPPPLPALPGESVVITCKVWAKIKSIFQHVIRGTQLLLLPLSIPPTTNI